MKTRNLTRNRTFDVILTGIFMVCATVFALGTARADSASDEWRIIEATVLDFAFTNTAVDLNGYHSIISDPLTIW